MFGDPIHDAKDKAKNLVQPAVGKQGTVAAIVHQRKAARGKQHQQGQNRQQQQPEGRRACHHLGHQPPEQRHRSQGAGHLQHSPEVIALAIGLKLKIAAPQGASRRPRRLKVGEGQRIDPRGQAIKPPA